MTDVGGSEQAMSQNIRGADQGGIRRLMLAAMHSASASRAYMLALDISDGSILVLARSNLYGSIEFEHSPAKRYHLDGTALRSMFGRSEAVAASSPARDGYTGESGRASPSVICVPLALVGRCPYALYLEIGDSDDAASRLDSVKWLVSIFSSALESEQLARDLENARLDAARVEAEMKLSLDMIPGLVWFASPDGLLEDASRSWHEYTGIPREEALGTGFIKAFHPDDAEKVLAKWSEMLAEGRPGGIEARMIRYDGEARYHITRAVPRFDGHGKVVRWYGVNADIDDLKRAEFELAKSQAVMAEAQRIIQTGSWSWDMAADNFTCSNECANIVGFESAEISFETLIARVHPDDRDMVAEAHGRALQGEELDVEHRFVLPHGEVKFIHARGRLMYDEAGGPRAYVGTLVDVTEARDSREKIKKALAEAQRAQASLAEAQKLSHVGSFQIRTSLNEINLSEETYKIYGLDHAQTPTVDALLARIHPDDRARVIAVHENGVRDQLPDEPQRRGLDNHPDPEPPHGEHRLHAIAGGLSGSGSGPPPRSCRREQVD